MIARALLHELCTSQPFRHKLDANVLHLPQRQKGCQSLIGRVGSTAAGSVSTLVSLAPGSAPECEHRHDRGGSVGGGLS